MEWIMSYSIENGFFGLVRYLVKNGKVDICYNNNEALYLAVRYNRKKTTHLLIENGADVHSNVEEPLTLAAEMGHWEIAHMLLESGANMHIASRNLVLEGHVDKMWKLVSLRSQ